MSTDAETSLLLDCLHQDARRPAGAALPAPDDARWDALLDLATRQRVRPLVNRRLRALPPDRVPGRVRRELEQATRRTGLRNLRFQAELAALARALAAQDIDVIVLKGAHLISSVYDGVALREMNDIDVLVRREHLQPVAGAAIARGYGPLKGEAVDVDPAVGHHLGRLLRPEVAAIEIHWNITPPADARAIDPAELWQRATPVTIGGERLRGLCREDLLLHLCYHVSYQHQFRFGLRPFCDLAATIAREGDLVDWRALARRAADWRWDRGVYLSLLLAQDLVGAGVPATVLQALKPEQFDDAVRVAARGHVLTESSADRMNPGVARLAGGESLPTRLRFLRARLLPPQGELARLYGLPPGSFRARLSYLDRAWNLARRHGASAARLLLARDRTLTDDAARASVLRGWLDS